VTTFHRGGLTVTTVRAPRPKRVRWAILLLGVLLANSGCSSATSPSEYSTTTRTVTVGGLERSFVLSAPTTVTSGARLPLLIMLHGAGADAAGFASLTGMTSLAEQSHFVVVYANGTQAADVPGELSWNSGVCCGAPSRAGIDDVAFIDRLIAEVEATLQTDPARVFVAGFSNGGMLSYRLACELGDRGAGSARIAGIADVAGAFNLPQCADARPTAVLVLHGTADTVVPYDGGPTSPGVAARFGTWLNASVADSTAAWAGTNQCQSEPAVEITGAIETSSFVGCVAGAPLKLVTIAGGSHRWPTRSNGGIPASGLIVEFFGLDQ
jgi:polyhydroxybutyrate depolymerase